MCKAMKANSERVQIDAKSTYVKEIELMLNDPSITLKHITNMRNLIRGYVNGTATNH